MSWRVRMEGSGNVVELPTAQKVLEGIREGDWEPSDDVRGPIDRDWTPIEEHAQFADVISEMGPPPAEEVDESRLDMNPLIDVALVLLVFFILTTSYSILRRTIDVPGEPDSKEEGKQAKPKQQVQEQMFKVELWMVDERPRLKINGDRIVEFDEATKALTDIVKATGKREMMLEFEGRVPWGTVASVIDAAKAADVVNVTLKRKKPG